MIRFKSAGQCQRFVSIHGSIAQSASPSPPQWNSRHRAWQSAKGRHGHLARNHLVHCRV